MVHRVDTIEVETIICRISHGDPCAAAVGRIEDGIVHPHDERGILAQEADAVEPLRRDFRFGALPDPGGSAIESLQNSAVTVSHIPHRPCGERIQCPDALEIGARDHGGVPLPVPVDPSVTGGDDESVPVDLRPYRPSEPQARFGRPGSIASACRHKECDGECGRHSPGPNRFLR
ncbi:MAG: hypothetical protein KAT47_01200 [Candidatus Aegiribacteria sp.]|nr:hypothetical protein [Candidatus Aegiribacteria sp.]